MTAQRQERLGSKDTSLAKPYSTGPYNKMNYSEQWIRLSEGCPHQCPYCYEPPEMKVYAVPEIQRTTVKIMDMNLLAHPESYDILEALPVRIQNDRVVHYEMVCGIDYRFLDEDIALSLKAHHFERLRIAWDWYYADQYKVFQGLNLLHKAGYAYKDLMVFMIANWRIPLDECLKKLDLCKVWRVKVADCYFDNQTFPRVTGVHWSTEECRLFRKKVRKHNQLVVFGFDPQIPKSARKEGSP